MLDMSSQQVLILIDLVSKACEHEIIFTKALLPDEVLAAQFKYAAHEAKEVLGVIDASNSGLIPLPHDGIPWRDR